MNMYKNQQINPNQPMAYAPTNGRWRECLKLWKQALFFANFCLVPKVAQKLRSSPLSTLIWSHIKVRDVSKMAMKASVIPPTDSLQ